MGLPELMCSAQGTEQLRAGRAIDWTLVARGTEIPWLRREQWVARRTEGGGETPTQPPPTWLTWAGVWSPEPQRPAL